MYYSINYSGYPHGKKLFGLTSYTIFQNKFYIHYRHKLKKEMTTHSRILAWEIPWTEEPGRLQSAVYGVTKESDMT